MNYYEILNVSKNATYSEIKISFRRLAMQWHPDRNQNSKESEEKFKEIKEAYETLSNESARFWYDKELEENINSENKYYYENNSNNSNNFNDESNEKKDNFEQENSTEHTKSDDENNTFSEQEDNLYRWRQKYPFNFDFHEYTLILNYEDYIIGKVYKFKYQFKNTFINLTINVPPKIDPEEILDVKITDTDVLLISLQILENPNKKLDIHSSIDLDIFTALNGITTKIATSNGIKEITIPPMTKNGDVLLFYGYGYQHSIFSGNLYVKINIYYPSIINEEQQDLLSRLSNIQQKRNKNLFLKIHSLFQEFIYFFTNKRK